MLFNSLVFIVFFAVFYTVYRLLPHRPQNLWLLACSWFFYGWWDWRFLALLAGTSLFDWLMGLALDNPDRPHRRFYVTASIVVNLGVLCTFKYLGFFVHEANALLEQLGIHGALPAVNLLLPVGLSFYTFQSMGYTIDVYRGDMRACRSFLVFSLFIAFFPHLVAGPIQRSALLLPQLERPRRVDPDEMAVGTYLILWGFFKKLFVADNLAVIVAQVFDAPTPPGGVLVLVAAYAFTWQIYCDFSGYSDIARGLSKWMGVELMVNFRLPFFASGPRDLWRRWHISLSQWLRDYLYIPLGGNRKGPMRTRFNLLTTMALGGLWHGANWTFIVWGIYHGLALAVAHSLPQVRLGRVAKALAIVATFHFTCLGFLIFRAHSMTQVGQLVTAMVTHMRYRPDDLLLARQAAVVIGGLFLAELVMYVRDDDLVLLRLPRPLQAGVAAALFLTIFILGASYGRQFIYFQF